MTQNRQDTQQTQIDGATEFLAVIGDPIAHALSPALFNPLLAARRRNAVLLPLRVTTQNLPVAVARWRGMENFRGALVTMPHKQSIVDLLDEIRIEGRLAEACNVVRREVDGKLIGTTLDGEGFILGLRKAGVDIDGKRAFLMGAGGAAASIAFALAKHGVVAITFHNRTRPRAEALARRVCATYPKVRTEVGHPSPTGHDLVINATSLGMDSNDGLPCDPSGFSAGMIVAEAVGGGNATPLLIAAEARGCVIHLGIHMLRGQTDLILDFILG